MVKCTCGRWFRNVGELATHVWRNKAIPPMHSPDESHPHTKKESERQKREVENGA